MTRKASIYYLLNYFLLLSLFAASCKKTETAEEESEEQKTEQPEQINPGLLITVNTDYYLKDHIATDDKGNFYTTGLLNGKQLLKINAKGELVKAYGALDFGMNANEIPYVLGVCNDKAGNVYVLILNANKPSRLLKLSSASDTPVLDRLIDHTNSSLGSTSLRDMEVSSTGDLYYIVEYQNYVVKKIDKTGQETYFIRAVDNKNPFDASLSVEVTDLSLDADNNLYVSVIGSTRNFFAVYKYAGDNKTELFRNTQNGFADGALAQARFNFFQSMLVSSNGKVIYLGDENRLRKIDLNNNSVSTVAGNSQITTVTYSYSGDALKGRCSPSKITFSADQKSIFINSNGVLQRLAL